MTDRPIIFSAPMVRALLAGRKTQTRRVLKLAGRTPEFIGPRGCEADPTCWGWEMPDGYLVTVEGDEADHAPGWRNGWRDWAGAYAPGDRLWVRESFCLLADNPHSDVCQIAAGDSVAYRATDDDEMTIPPRWRPSIHMPRWASRLTLTVTDVRVQRLWDLTDEDAIAEGISHRRSEFYSQGVWTHGGDEGWHTPEAAYRNLWNSLHGPGAWDANPWVTAISFRVALGNIDQMPGVA